MTAALIYTRVSKDPKGRGRSVAEQETECRRVCEREGWQIADVLSDNGRSASRYATRSRPAWNEVKKRLASGKVDVLVTWEASRNGRDLAEFVELRGLMRKHGVLLNYSGRSLDFEDSRDSFAAGLDALLAEDEAERTRNRILRSVRSQAEQGRPHGRRLYGYVYTYDDKTGALVGQVPEPDEAKIVKEVAKRYLAGESAYAIGEDLNARGVPFPTGARWSETRIKRMLTNPAYIGMRVHKGEISGKAAWSAILDQATFDAIAVRYEDPSHAQSRGGHDVRHLLSGIARCGKCGAPLYVGHDRKNRLVYACRAPGRRGEITRSREHLDAFVTAVVLERLANVDLTPVVTDNGEVAAARAEAAELRGRLDDAVAQFTAGKLTATTLAKVERELLGRIADAERAAREKVTAPIVRDLAGKGVDARWDGLSVEQRREVIRTLLDVTVLPSSRPRGSRGFDPDAVRIEWLV